MTTKHNEIVAASVGSLVKTEANPRAQNAEILEPWATLAEVCAHFRMSRITVWRNVKNNGMPAYRLPGGHGIRFQMSKVQRWLEENQRDRFAANGRRSTIEALQRRIVEIPILNGIEIVEKMPRSGGKSEASERGA